MKHHNKEKSRMKTRMQGALWARIGLIAVIVVAVSSMAHAKDKRQMVVMTQNLYLGASLDAAIGIDPDDPNAAERFIAAVALIYWTVGLTDFPARAAAIADQIEAQAEETQAPDIIGLQEVSDWTVTKFVEGLPAPRSYNFLDILLKELEDRHLFYREVEEATSDNADIGPIPLALCYDEGVVLPSPMPPGIYCTVSLLDRDVILVKKNTPDLEVFNAQNGNYSKEAQVVLQTPVGELSFNRGWGLVDGTFQGKKFRFVNTHLEIGGPGGFADAQEAQGQEFLAGPAKSGGAVIAVGDFNSRADGSSTTTYADLTKSYFDDAWDDPDDPGYTCCQNETLTNPESALPEGSAIDFVFTHAPVRAVSAEVVGGDIPFQAVPPFWPSDHAGVVATVRIH
jgi:endonuclease/exonuclease/phosphatase family metal-dependent hydrolase